MQLINLASVAALSATVSANTLTDMAKVHADSLTSNSPKVRIVNRCPYTVYAWSVGSGNAFDCVGGTPFSIAQGDSYQEVYRTAAVGGISIKLGKTNQCKSGSLAQLEYYREFNSPGHKFDFNSLDFSYVDCGNNDCPTRSEGFYLKSGNQGPNGKTYASVAGAPNECPILHCTDPASCNKIAYVDPNDVQTKTCNNDADLVLYMCGGEAPGSEASNNAPVAGSKQPPSSKAPSTPPSPIMAPAAATNKPPPTDKVKAAEVTPAPQPPKAVKTVVTYVTVAVDGPAKRHAHGRRHQHFHA